MISNQITIHIFHSTLIIQEVCMTNLKNNSYDVGTVINGAIGSEDNYCMGYGNPGANGNGYITTIKLSVGLVNVDQSNRKYVHQGIPLDIGTAGIVSYDRCETNDAYIGAINMLTASSFTGMNGAVWGYDLAVADNLRSDLLYYEKWMDGSVTPVYNILPLLDTTQRLFGTADNRRFTPLPGSMVICANKNCTPDTMNTSAWAWSFIALSFLDNRISGSNLFIEDCNYFPGDWSEDQVCQELYKTMQSVTKCVVLCGEDQRVKYKEIFIGFKYVRIEAGQIGCSLACAPYVTLARNAIPNGIKPADLMNFSIGQWEKALNLPPLSEIAEYQKGHLEMGSLTRSDAILSPA